MKRLRAFSAVIVAIVIVAFGISGFTTRSDDDYFAIRKNFEIFGSIYENLVLEYVDEVDAERLMRAGIRAMLNELDPYTVFFDEVANEQMDIAGRGKTGSPGISIGAIDGQIRVTAPEFGASGYKQGVRTGDQIVSVARRPVSNLTANDTRSLLYGEPGTVVDVVVQRPGQEGTISFVLTRDKITYESVSYAGNIESDDGLKAGYIKLDHFGRTAAVEVKGALDTLLASNPEIIILDLRDNPGGLLTEAVGIVSLFTPSGTPVVSTIGRAAETNQLFKSSGSPVYPDGQLIVLTNNISASASEIVAGALQDHDRALVVGSRTFGKGLVQVINNLPYNTSLKLTTARYFIPSGRSIQNIQAGVAPSSAVPDSLRKPFRTKNGRTVKDGAGIEPDILTEASAEPEIVQALLRRSAFFSFANYFRSTGAEIKPSFEVSDDVFNMFTAWLADQNFSYQTEAEKRLDRAKQAFEISDFSISAFAQVDSQLLEEKAKELERRSERIRKYLHEEILSRYLDDTSYFQVITGSDETIAESLRLAANPDRLSQLLGR